MHVFVHVHVSAVHVESVVGLQNPAVNSAIADHLMFLRHPQKECLGASRYSLVWGCQPVDGISSCILIRHETTRSPACYFAQERKGEERPGDRSTSQALAPPTCVAARCSNQHAKSSWHCASASGPREGGRCCVCACSARSSRCNLDISSMLGPELGEGGASGSYGRACCKSGQCSRVGMSKGFHTNCLRPRSTRAAPAPDNRCSCTGDGSCAGDTCAEGSLGSSSRISSPWPLGPGVDSVPRNSPLDDELLPIV